MILNVMGPFQEINLDVVNYGTLRYKKFLVIIYPPQKKKKIKSWIFFQIQEPEYRRQAYCPLRFCFRRILTTLFNGYEILVTHQTFI